MSLIDIILKFYKYNGVMYLYGNPWTGSRLICMPKSIIIRRAGGMRYVCVCVSVSVYVCGVCVCVSVPACSNELPDYLITGMVEFSHTRRNKIWGIRMPPRTTKFASTLNNRHQTNSIFLHHVRKQSSQFVFPQ